MKHPLTREQARRDYEQAMLRYALLEAQERQADQLAAAYSPMPGENEALRARVMAALGRGGAWRDTVRLTRMALPRLGKALAILLIVFAIGMPAAIATIPPVRARVMELIFETLRQYTRVSLREKAGQEVEVPAEWGGEYYPSYIPEGYEFDEVLGGTHVRNVYYLSNKGDKLRFSEYGEGTSTRLDTENADVKFVMINGNPGMLVEKNGRIILTWSEYDFFFVIIADDMPSDSVMNIANSVVRIK